MVDMAKLAIEVDSTQATTAASNLDALGTSANKVDGRINTTNKNLGNFGRRAGQAGIQIQQFVGQVQGGVSPIVAFSQQSADLGFVLGFPLLGAVTAIAASFAGPLITAVTGTSKEMEDLDDNIQNLIKSLDSSEKASNEAMLARLEQQAAATAAEIENLNSSVDGMTGRQRHAALLSNVSRFEDIERITASIAELESRTVETGRQRRATASQIVTLKSELNRLTGVDESRAAKIADLEKQRATQLEAIAAIQKKMDDSPATIFADMQTNIDPKAFVYDDWVKEQKDLDAARVQSRADMLKAIERIEKQSMSATERAADAYLEQQARIALALGEGVITTQEADAAKTASTKAYYDTVARKQDQQNRRSMQANQTTLSASADFFGNMASIAAAGGEEQFQTWKALASAQAAISATLAVVNTLANPNIPYPLNIGLAASIGALAAVQVAQIQQQEYTPARAFGGQVQAGTTYLVGERGPELVTMGANGYVTPNDKLQGNSQTVVLQVSTGVSQTVRAEMAAMMPGIVKMIGQATQVARR